MGTNTTPLGKAHEPTRDQFTDWDCQTPYPKTTEGKAAYEVAIQAWWERNGFNSRASAADLIPLTPGTVPVGMNKCYVCGHNNNDNTRFPHCSIECPIIPKIPRQEANWHASSKYQTRGTATGQQNQTPVHQIEEYDAYQGQEEIDNSDQGNGEEPAT